VWILYVLGYIIIRSRRKVRRLSPQSEKWIGWPLTVLASTPMVYTVTPSVLYRFRDIIRCVWTACILVSISVWQLNKTNANKNYNGQYGAWSRLSFHFYPATPCNATHGITVEIFAESDPPPSKNADYDRFPLITSQP